MADVITVRPTHFRRRALVAFNRNAGPHSHGLNPQSAAAITFVLRYQRLAKLREATDKTYFAPGVRQRIDYAQEHS